MKKKKRITKVKLVKAMSRAVIGTVPGERVVPDKKKRLQSKKSKHKATLSELLVEE
jgi:hypothetical protein